MYLLIKNLSHHKVYLGIVNGKKIIKAQEIKLAFNEGEKLLYFIDKFLKVTKININELKGIVVNKGPGFFTSLRLVIILANTWAYVKKIPIYGLPADNFSNMNKLLGQLKKTKPVKFIEPIYGSAPQITKSKRQLW